MCSGPSASRTAASRRWSGAARRADDENIRIARSHVASRSEASCLGITNMKASKVSADNKGGKTPRRQSDQGKSAVGRLGNALHGRRIGIGFRLFGAFGAVAFLTLVATGIAWLSFVNVGSVLNQVTDRSRSEEHK